MLRGIIGELVNIGSKFGSHEQGLDHRVHVAGRALVGKAYVIWTFGFLRFFLFGLVLIRIRRGWRGGCIIGSFWLVLV